MTEERIPDEHLDWCEVCDKELDMRTAEYTGDGLDRSWCCRKCYDKPEEKAK